MDLLIELLSEEIPARMQARAADDLRRMVTQGLVDAGLTYASAGAFATPRRLALAVEGLSPESAPVREERKGPRTDAPQAAIDGFLRSTGLTLDQLERRAEKKAEVYFAVTTRPGRPAEAIIAEVLGATIRAFPWPKAMRWGAGSLRWVRPLQSILAILTDEAGARVVPFAIEGLSAGDTTVGHRFMAPASFRVSSFADYEQKLRAAKVLLDPAERAAAIRQEAESLAFARGLALVPDEALLAEVAGLVEWPVPLMGEIEARFLDLPPEVVRTSMREHQKFFSARNAKTGRIEAFVTVANIETPDNGAAILAGNRRVLAARLSDAVFFWENDLREARAGMGAWAKGLESVTFHAKLGSQADRVARIAALAREIAPAVGADADEAEQAAKIAKLDLRSAMVGEFPELQGAMGRYYAKAAGITDAVADAARDHYSPLGPNDAVPSAPVSVAVALADKIDTLAGFWAIDEKPTGSKDPYALRRAALGVIRLVLGNGVRLSAAPLFQESVHGLYRSFTEVFNLFRPDGTSDCADGDPLILTVYDKDGDEPFFVTFEPARNLHAGDDEMAFIGGEPLPYKLTNAQGIASDLLSFLHDRLKVHLREHGIRHDVIDAVLTMPDNDDLILVIARATALNDMLGTEDGTNLLQGLKRAANILAQAEARDGVEYSFGPDSRLAEAGAEVALFAALDAAEPKIAAATAAEDFPAAMAAIAALRGPIDAFFDGVQVNAESPVLRRNRLNLLHRIRATGAGIADFGRLEG